MPLKPVRFFSRTQVDRLNSKMKADWFTIIKKCADNKQKNENEGGRWLHPFAVENIRGGLQKSHANIADCLFGGG